MSNNRKHNSTNRYQGSYKKVLCLCSAGLLRSPTAAVVLSQEPFNFNTRAAGMEEDYALIPVDDVLLGWADEIVVMSPNQEAMVMIALSKQKLNTPIVCLNIPDNYAYRDPALMQMIADNYSSGIQATPAE